MEAAGASAYGTDARRVWIAAAAARSWTATAHQVALWETCRNAWGSMSEASEAGRNAAAAGGEAVGRDGMVSGTVLGDAANSLKEAARALLRARTAFTDASELAKRSAAEWERAARAHERAGDARNEATVRAHVDKSREAGRAAAKWASKADRDADTAKKALRKWDACADMCANRSAWTDERAEWLDEQARIHADAEYGRAMWLDRAGQADETMRAAADDLRQYAELAGEIALAAGLPDDIPPGSENAARAWRDAMASARRAANAYRSREWMARAAWRAAD